MKFVLVLVMSLGSIFAPMFTSAAEVSAAAKIYYSSPCYYTSTVGDFQIYLKGTPLDGVRAELDYGFQLASFSDGKTYDWSYKGVTPLPKNQNQLMAQITGQTLHARSASGRLERIQFVIKIRYPDGRVEINNGGNSPWGYFEARLPSPTNTCSNDVSAYVPLQLSRVLKY